MHCQLVKPCYAAAVTASFFQRPYPSANNVLLHGPSPVLVDTGFGADVPELLAWLHGLGTPLERLRIVNTHSHCDHSGGNWALQTRFGARIGADAFEAAAVNARDPDAGRARWLRQPIEPYAVDHLLREGDVVETGAAPWQVLATPGHTRGHLSLYQPDHGILVLGDALHAADLGWLNPYHEGVRSLDHAAATLDRLAALPARVGYSGHGAALSDLPRALDRAHRRVQSWRDAPERIAWHACKRVFSHALMLAGGLTEPELAPMLLDAPWFRDHAEQAFGLTPEAFVPLLVQETIRADAATWRDGRLVAVAAHQAPRPGWPSAPASPDQWPPRSGPAPSQGPWAAG